MQNLTGLVQLGRANNGSTGGVDGPRTAGTATGSMLSKPAPSMSPGAAVGAKPVAVPTSSKYGPLSPSPASLAPQQILMLGAGVLGLVAHVASLAAGGPCSSHELD